MEEERFKKGKTAIFLRTDMTSDMIRVRTNTKLKYPFLYIKQTSYGVNVDSEEKDKHTTVKNIFRNQRESREKQSIVFITTAAIQNSWKLLYSSNLGSSCNLHFQCKNSY